MELCENDMMDAAAGATIMFWLLSF